MTDAFLKKIVGWAERRDDIACLIMTGSRARPGAIVDAFSDYDLEIFAEEPRRYTDSSDWMKETGSVWVFLPTESDRGWPTRLIIFEGGTKADFSIRPVAALEEAVRSQRLDPLYERGYLVLVDKRGLASELRAPSGSPPRRELPAEAEFRATVEEFWFEAWHIPKYLAREELWVVKYRDWTMKEMLLRMLEWRALAEGDPQADVGEIGVQMREWTPPHTWERLHEVFGRFDAGDSRRALLATMALFREVATETAERLGHRYPRELDDAISVYVDEALGRFE
jgi:aminoglycoside 6-adenylyltransferase